MPTPWQILTDPISLVFLAMYAGILAWEALAPGRELPPVPGWKLRGLASFAVYFFIASYLPLLWTETLLRWQLLDLTGLGTALGTVVGLLVYEVVGWAWHWSMHRFDLLWRTFHQMHHSAERLDGFGAFYFSPLDMIGWTFAGSFALTLLVGVTAQAATNVLLLVSFLAMFQHANVRTPHWLGYLVQRPESHTIHHGRGVHRYNYADLALVDLAFGTLRNPRGYELPTGFYDGASSRVVDMLVGRDVTRPRRPAHAPDSRPRLADPANPRPRPRPAAAHLETTTPSQGV